MGSSLLTTITHNLLISGLRGLEKPVLWQPMATHLPTNEYTPNVLFVNAFRLLNVVSLGQTPRADLHVIGSFPNRLAASNRMPIRDTNNHELPSPRRHPRLCGFPSALILILVLATLSPQSTYSVGLNLEVHGSFLWAQGTVMSADSALVVVGSPSGIRFFAEQDDGEFALIGEHTVPHGVRDLILRDSIVYYADTVGALAAVSIADPANAEYLGTFGTGHTAIALTLSS